MSGIFNDHVKICQDHQRDKCFKGENAYAFIFRKIMWWAPFDF